MFVVECKNQPGSFWVSKDGFDKITANAQHHQVDNVEVGVKLTTQTKVQHHSTEAPLMNPGNISANELRESVTNKAGKEKPLGSPTLDFSKDN